MLRPTFARDEKFLDILTTLAGKLEMVTGASRATVDADYGTNDWQVDQTDRILAPQLNIAAWILGPIQHLAGMNDSKVTEVINKGPVALIFSLANYGKADLFTAAPELVQQN
jgi:electron transfer flavoprotein alpha subunit